MPELLGSTEEDTPTDWTNLGGNIWTTQPAVNLVTTSGSELLPNPSFSSNTSNWTFYKNSPAAATGAEPRPVVNGIPRRQVTRCITLQTRGVSPDDIQLYTYNLSITSGNYYLLTFDAKCTSSFALAGIVLQGNTSPYTYYATVTTSTTPTITTSWATYKVLFLANTTATNARLDFYLGGAIPVGSTFYLDTLSFKKCAATDGQRLPTSDPVYGDVGNIIFNNAEDDACGCFERSLSDLTTQGDFWTDPSNWTVKLYSTSNPATYYSSIEMAVAGDIIDGGNYNTYQNLDVRYGGTHGITLSGGPGSPVHDSTVTGCDVSWCGGGNFDGTLRFGNAYPGLARCDQYTH